MNRDKKLLYLISLVTLAALFGLMFIKVESSRIAVACLLLPIALITRFLIKKRSAVSIHKREVLILTAGIGILFLVALHMSGLYFGYYKNPYFVSSKIFLNFVLPTAAVIVALELYRSTILAQKSKIADWICFFSCLLAETMLVANVVGITSFNLFMDVVGLSLFPAISTNVYCHYATKRFGMLPTMAFRAFTTLYVYFFTTTPAIPDSLMSCIKLVLPIVMMVLTMLLFEKKEKKVRSKGGQLGTVAIALTMALVLSIAALISCQFRYGAIVIATGSMTGEINKGDMIIYERYEDQPIKEGQVIVFQKDKAKIVHRVVEIERVGEETRYYTKGDANSARDEGYRVEADVVGLTDIKVSYIGYPTLLLRELVSSNT